MTRLRTPARRLATVLVTAAFVLVPSVIYAAHGVAQEPPGPYPTVTPGFRHSHDGPLGEEALLIERALRCVCGCTMDTHSCQFQMQCPFSPGWSERIQRDLEASKTPEAIMASFVADYGTVVLIAPPAEGFNLLGYFLPAATILLAGALLVVAARSRMKHLPAAAPLPEVNPEDAERLRAEWQKIDEAESPDW